jgi:hypothetical protein
MPQQAMARLVGIMGGPKHQPPYPKAECGKLHVRFDERDLETETRWVTQTPPSPTGLSTTVLPTHRTGREPIITCLMLIMLCVNLRKSLRPLHTAMFR